MGLLRALLPHKEAFRPFSERCRRGTVLWSLGSILEALRDRPGQLADLLPTPGMNPLVSAALRDESVNTASTVFQSWVSLVYMRADDVLVTLRSLRSRDPHLGSFVKLLGLDEVRYIRNSLAHGTFEAEFGEFRWWDGKKNGLLPYELLRELNGTVFALWLSIDAIAIAPDGATLDEDS